MGKIIAIVVLAGLVLAGSIVGLYFGIWHTADPRGALEAREQIRADGDYRIQAYNWYFKTCGDAVSQQDKVQGNWELLQQMEMGSDRYWKKAEELTAIENTLARFCNTYTAKADQEETHGLFKEECLPESLNAEAAIEQAKKGERIECECKGEQQGPY